MTTAKTRTTITLFGALAIGGTVALGATGSWAQAVKPPVPVSVQVQTMTPHVSAKDYVGKSVFTSGGKEIGLIKNMLQTPGQPQVYALVTLGGPVMSTMEPDILIPAAEMSFTTSGATITHQATQALVAATPIHELRSTAKVTQ